MKNEITIVKNCPANKSFPAGIQHPAISSMFGEYRPSFLFMAGQVITENQGNYSNNITNKNKSTIMKKTFKLILKLSLPLLYILLALRSHSQTAQLNMKDAINTAISGNRPLRSDSINIALAENKTTELAGLFRPQGTFSAGTEYNPAIASQMVPGKFLGQPDKDYVPVQMGSRYNLKNGVELSQIIYRKDLVLQLKATAMQKGIALTKYNMSKEQLVYQVASTYYSLQNSAELIRTTKSDYNNLLEVLRIAKAQYETGVLRRIDYESIQINTANKESYLNQLQTQYNDELAYFNYLLGLPVSAETVIENFVATAIPSFDGSEPVLQRQDIRLSYQMIALKEQEIKKIRAEKLPVINSYIRLSYQSQLNSPGKVFNSEYWSTASTLGVSVSIPLFDGNRRKTRIKSAQMELEQLQLQKNHTKETADMEFFSAAEVFNNYLKQYRITEKNLVLAEKVFASRKALYTEGVTTLVELLDAERELSQSRTLFMQAAINMHTGWLNLHKAKGTLLTDFLKSI